MEESAETEIEEEKTWRIGEVAGILNLNTSVLRFWESKFPQIEPIYTEKGQRLYTGKQVALLRRIQQLLHEQGLTIEGARRVLEGKPIDPEFLEMLTDELLAIRDLLADSEET